jgi:hypothetical protein
MAFFVYGGVTMKTETRDLRGKLMVITGGSQKLLTRDVRRKPYNEIDDICEMARIVMTYGGKESRRSLMWSISEGYSKLPKAVIDRALSAIPHIQDTEDILSDEFRAWQRTKPEHHPNA